MILQIDMKLALMQVQALRENNFRIDPAETVLYFDLFPFTAGILTDRFESDRTVLINQVCLFMGYDGAFQIA